MPTYQTMSDNTTTPLPQRPITSLVMGGHWHPSALPGGTMVPVRNDGVDDLPAGLPVYVAGAGLVAPARADSETASQVFGLLTQPLPGSGLGWAMLNGGCLTSVTSWQAVVGTDALEPGKVYYLGRDGGLSLEAPAEIIVPTIRAFTTTAALIQIQPGIQLGPLL